MISKTPLPDCGLPFNHVHTDGEIVDEPGVPYLVISEEDFAKYSTYLSQRAFFAGCTTATVILGLSIALGWTLAYYL